MPTTRYSQHASASTRRASASTFGTAASCTTCSAASRPPDVDPPLLVVVTGPPAAGKTTVARALAREVQLPLFEKDVLKEALFDTLGTGDSAWSRRLGAVVVDLLFSLMEVELAAGRSLAVEANFDRTRAEPLFRRLPPHRLVQVHCSAPDDVVLGRYAARRRHPGHLDAARLDEVGAALADGRHAPLELDGALVGVETSAVEAPALGAIVARVPARRRPFDPPLLLVVTGAPATGKSTVAHELAERLHVPFISKDTLKERLYEVFGSGEEIEDAVERAALAVLFAVVEAQLAAGVSVMGESNFDANTETEPFRRLCKKHRVRLVQIHCYASTEAVLQNYAERAVSGRRHPGHEDEPEKVDEVRAKLAAGLWDPLDLPGELIELPVIEVDVDYDALTERVRALASQ